MTFRATSVLIALVSVAGLSGGAVAQDASHSVPLSALCVGATGAGKCLSVTSPVKAPLAVQSWMSPEVGSAWAGGFKGQGTTITMVDDFSSTSRFSGNFGLGFQYQRHGEWTREEAGMVAPLATVRSKDFNTIGAVALAPGLNVMNLSYGMYARAGYSVGSIGWSAQEASLISYAGNGSAVISKAAGNDSVPVGAINSGGQQDYLDLALIGKQSAILVGALNANGTPTAKASMAWYSDTAGNNLAAQRQFLVVGVTGATTGLYGTSFAAPIITGYAAIIGSKFTTATPTQVANDLLNTARTDTLSNYNPATYGRGEASLARALAPVAIR